MRRPIFDSLTLDAVADAFHRRGKAIRYHGKLSATRTIDAGDERLDVGYSGLRKLRMSLSVWSNGEWWFLVFQARPGRNGGWLFKHELRGELGNRPADAIVKSFEDSRLTGYWPADEQLAKLEEVWHLRRRPTEA
jgi:hypothetical protein